MKKLSLKSETLVELTATDLGAVVGGGDSDFCSCGIASCITNDLKATIHIEKP